MSISDKFKSRVCSFTDTFNMLVKCQPTVLHYLVLLLACTCFAAATAAAVFVTATASLLLSLVTLFLSRQAVVLWKKSTITLTILLRNYTVIYNACSPAEKESHSIE